MNGLELVKKVRSDPRFTELPNIMVTTEGGKAEVITALKAGVNNYIVKPFTPHNFRGTGKLLILRIGGNLTGDSKRELSFIGKDNVKRAISETMQWFDSHDEH